MISKLHYITHDLPGKSHAQLAEEACIAGADWIQLRVKNRSCEEWKEIALATQVVCKKYGAKLIINDSMTLAKDINAEGVHLGKNDMRTVEARKVLGKDFIIGGTANTFEDVLTHVEAGVDYIGLGPFRFTSTKEKLSPVLGIEGYRNILNECRNQKIEIPVIAIGGVTAADVMNILETGVHGIAVSGAITNAMDKKMIISEFKNALKSKKHETA